MSKRIIDRSKLSKNTAKTIRFVDKNVFGVKHKYKKRWVIGEIVDEWNEQKDEDDSWMKKFME